MKVLLEWTGTKLYRCTGLTNKELQTYKDLVGKIKKDKTGSFTSGYMTMTGFISTSLNRFEA